MMEIKTIHPNDGRFQLTLDPKAFIINSLAMGDVIATAPVIKYLLDNFYTTPESYYLVVKKAFWDFFPFVPEDKLLDFDATDKSLWGIHTNTPLALLNRQKSGMFVRPTPKKMHLSHYASLALADSIIPLEQLKYVQLRDADTSKFGYDFSKWVIIISSYRDENRSWSSDEMLKFATGLKDRGLTPVFIGKTDTDFSSLTRTHKTFSSLPQDISEYGIDLRNSTTISELASIMSKSFAVCGIDSGPLHLAGTTNVPIIAGYTTVLGEYRIPLRDKTACTIMIPANVECYGCESRWNSSLHNFENCYYGHRNCITTFKALDFLNAIDRVGHHKELCQR